MSIYKIVRSLSVAVLLTTSISFAMDSEEKKSDDEAHKVRLRELFASDGMPLLTTEGIGETPLAGFFGSNSATGSVHVNSSSVSDAEKHKKQVRDFASKLVPEEGADSLAELLLMSPEFGNAEVFKKTCASVRNLLVPSDMEGRDPAVLATGSMSANSSTSSSVYSFVSKEERKSEFAKMLRLAPEFKDISEDNLEKIASASMDILDNAAI